MSEVWLLEAYDDPYVSPYTIGVFESKEQLVDTVNEDYGDNFLEWEDGRVVITFEVRSYLSSKVVRTEKVRLDFRPFPVGEIYG